MHARIDSLQSAGNIVLRERMMRRGETPGSFVHRMAAALTNQHPTKALAVQELLRAVALIPSSSVCRYFNTGKDMPGKDTPSACYLFVFSKNHTAEVKLKELWTLANMVIMGTGVGVGADNLNSQTSSNEGELQNSFVEICKYLNQSINLSVTVRKSRLAVYVSLHNINAYMCLTLREQNNLVTPNIFYGLMIPDLFMRSQDKMWYFFDGSTIVDGKSLNDCYGIEYEELYAKMVAMELYVKAIPANALMGEIVSCITENGFPYIVWRDTVNRYNNQQALGPIQTLNLCAEVCQHASDSLLDKDSSLCTLLTLNVAAYWEQYEQSWNLIYDDLKACDVSLDCVPPLDDDLLAHCFYGAYMATFILNCMLGDSARREIGVSPTGLFDAVCLKYGVDAAYEYAMEDSAGPVSEYIYLGSVLASVVYNRQYNVECVNFKHSCFARGEFQFDLRHITPILIKQWAPLRSIVRAGMANSMLTAQAPTATTSLITNVTESVQFPLPGKVATTKNSKTGRFADVPFYAAVRPIDTITVDHRDVSVRKQIKVYVNSAPYVDQSQSVIVNCRPEYEETLKILYYTHTGQLKTGIYYLSFISPTSYLNLGNDIENEEKKARSKFNTCSGCTL
ncbi:rr1 [Hyphantria cunea granulovirus]|uniref:Rr1 n=1 Tax=Hyphantria cunea granulovirus TaxID=307448 RepID=A0AAF1D2B3_9BBAC|nr:rr1 [Hyphantria cunea granulovirus]QBQ01670.1 rr1 [Hyphantria cunea granulovirus]